MLRVSVGNPKLQPDDRGASFDVALHLVAFSVPLPPKWEGPDPGLPGDSYVIPVRL